MGNGASFNCDFSAEQVFLVWQAACSSQNVHFVRSIFYAVKDRPEWCEIIDKDNTNVRPVRLICDKFMRVQGIIDTLLSLEVVSSEMNVLTTMNYNTFFSIYKEELSSEPKYYTPLSYLLVMVMIIAYKHLKAYTPNDNLVDFIKFVSKNPNNSEVEASLKKLWRISNIAATCLNDVTFFCPLTQKVYTEAKQLFIDDDSSPPPNSI